MSQSSSQRDDPGARRSDRDDLGHRRTGHDGPPGEHDAAPSTGLSLLSKIVISVCIIGIVLFVFALLGPKLGKGVQSFLKSVSSGLVGLAEALLFLSIVGALGALARKALKSKTEGGKGKGGGGDDGNKFGPDNPDDDPRNNEKPDNHDPIKPGPDEHGGGGHEEIVHEE